MDRSLKFFLNAQNSSNTNNTDKTTGLKTTKHEVKQTINYYDPNDTLKKPIKTEEKTITYNVINSLQSQGKFINYLGNSNNNEYSPLISDPSTLSDTKLSTIIKWSNQYKSMTLRPEYFVYLKDFLTKPANRMIVLRRFGGPIREDLFKVNNAPIHTLVSYYDLEETPVKISFNERWTQFDSSFMEVIQNVIGIKFDSIPGLKTVSEVASGSPLAQDLLHKIGQKLGFITGGEMPYGDPNIIYDAAVRDVSGEDVNTGLESSIDVDFQATYVHQEIYGIPAKVAMLDIISNVVAMGTSPERFYVTGAGGAKLNGLISEMAKGNVGGLFNLIVQGITEIVQDAISAIVNAATQVVQDVASGDTSVLDAVIGAITSIASSLLKSRYQRYKWQLRGAVGAMTGYATAPWHITLGNPMYPWFSCGNMVVEKVELEAGGELGYDDMFTELTVKIKLRQGRHMGANGLTSLFNNGKGRIYDTPDKVQTLNVPLDANVTLPPNATEGSATQTNTNPPTEANNTQDTIPNMEVPNTTPASITETPPAEDQNIQKEQTSKKGYTYLRNLNAKTGEGFVYANKNGQFEDQSFSTYYPTPEVWAEMEETLRADLGDS